MAIRIVESSEGLIAEIRAMNQRLSDAGSRWGFYDSPVPDWLAGDDGSAIWRRFLIAQDERTGTVHGGYVLKQQPFLADQTPAMIGNVQGPVSEGLIVRRHALVGPLLIRDSLARMPLQFTWGTSARKAALLAGSGWIGGSVPILVDPVRPSRVLRQLSTRLSYPAARALARLAARLHVADPLVAGRRAAIAMTGPSLRGVDVRAETSFGDWADVVWQAARSDYRLIAERTAVALNRVMPAGSWPDAQPISVWQGGTPVGWAALRIQRSGDHPQFGELAVGSVIDALAVPGHEATVAAASMARLRGSNVDLIGAAFADRRWVDAFASAGCFAVRQRRNLMLSPALAARMNPFTVHAGLHLTLIDGDGPRSL